MNCPNCNASLQDGVRFCNECGTPVPQPPMQQPNIQQPPVYQPPMQPPQGKSKPKWILPVVIAVLATAILALVLVLILRGKEISTVEPTTVSPYVQQQNEAIPAQQSPAQQSPAQTPPANAETPAQTSPAATTAASISPNLFVEPNPNANDADRLAWFRNALAQVIDMNKMEVNTSLTDNDTMAYKMRSSAYATLSRPFIYRDFTMNGIVFSPFMTFSEITATGLQFVKRNSTNSIQPGFSEIVTFEMAGYTYEFWMSNATQMATKQAEDLILTGVYGNIDSKASKSPNIRMIFESGILDNYSSVAEIFTQLGEPDKIYFSAGTLNYIHAEYTFYAEDSDVKLELEFQVDTKTGKLTEINTDFSSDSMGIY